MALEWPENKARKKAGFAPKILYGAGKICENFCSLVARKPSVCTYFNVLKANVIPRSRTDDYTCDFGCVFHDRGGN